MKDEESGSCLWQCVAPTIFIGIIAGIAITVILYGPARLLRWVLSFTPEHPSWQFALGLCLAIAICIVVLMPLWPALCWLSGLLYGVLVGAVINCLAVLTAAIVCFVLGRSFLQQPIRECLAEGGWSRTRRMLLVLEDETNSLKFLTLFRFLLIPMFLRNYGPSVLEVPLQKLALSVVPHSVWISILYSCIGAAFHDSAQVLRASGEFDWHLVKWQEFVSFGVGLCVTALLMWYAHREYSRKVEEEQQQGIAGVAVEGGEAKSHGG